MAARSRLLRRDPDDPFLAYLSVLVPCTEDQRDRVREIVEHVAHQLELIPPDPRATHETEGSGTSYVSVEESPDGIMLSAGLDLPMVVPPQGA